MASNCLENAAWLTVLKGFRLFSEGKGTEEDDFGSALDLLCAQGLSPVFPECFLDSFRKILQKQIVPDFWRHLESGTDHLAQAVQELYMNVHSYAPLVKRLALEEGVRSLLKACMLASLQLDFHQKVIEFYSRAFKIYVLRDKAEALENVEEACTCNGCNREIESCICQDVLHTLERVNRQLADLGLLMPLVGDAVVTVVQHYIEEYVQENCKGNFEVFYKATLQEWLQKNIFGWLQWIFRVETEALAAFREGLGYYMEETYAGVRMEQLFNIIIEFPESQAALEDLRECLDRTNLRPKLIDSLKKSLETRLLHPGVNTADILTAYISAIKALKVLDPAGVILQLACEPICRYLRSRDDTVRCIVSSLIDDSCELTTELMRTTDDSEQDSNWEFWQPDPVDADPAKAPKSQRSSDIIGMLVNIYGTRELFVKEYQTLLADRLLSGFCYDTEREIRYLELLKLRFGESLLHNCEVMLRDVADSKRINAHVASSATQLEDFPVNAMVVSAQFWPAFREDKVELPEMVQAALERYTRAFEALKGNRTLGWKPALGMVNLEVALKDRTLNLAVSPLHAAILWHFQEKSRWSVEDLSQVLKSCCVTVRRRITFWQNHGVLHEETPDVFVLQEERTYREGPTPEDMDEELEMVEAMTASSQEQKEEELQMFWSFIVGMLTNLESLPLEQIHTMLHMFAVQGSNASEWSLHQLRQFLGRKVCQDKLIFSNGVYRLPS